MKCKKCGYELTEDMNFCPKCGNPVAGYELNGADHGLVRSMFEKLFKPVKVTEEVKAKLKRHEKYEEAVAEIGRLCGEFLAEAEERAEKNPNGSRYFRSLPDLRGKLDVGLAEEPVFFCCDVFGDVNTLFAVTNFGLRYVTESCCGKPKFLDLALFDDVSFADGHLELNDLKERVWLGISDEEGKKLVELLHKAYELIADACEFDKLEEALP